MSSVQQSKYQVRFAFGLEAGAQIAQGAHVVVWADALPSADADADALAITPGAAVVAGTTGSRAAVASWILDRQAQFGDRAIVAVVAAGGPGGTFAVEDFLAAGAVIDALGDLGIDFTSPEAAAAAGAYAMLKNAANHLLSASVAGQEAGPDAVTAAREYAARTEVTVLREFTSPA